ncbi:hypothetical protein [Pedobacter punctiformis]|uniref:Uncharacterized protein n=1 Tax=Pedobacter punctiformis TaxID=3004097 RepID=A0ABT4L8L3_9SPHI|nr:hypothetical protein [Pedobacter sp. HCMS5-2]MCZ4244250.1 hypothetical protein [Pedobacter sp. HCMS5-2]
MDKNNHAFPLNPNVVVVQDSSITIAPDQSQEKKKKKSSEKQDKAQQPEIDPTIKQVPKARKQLKPAAIKPAIKVKPIKIIRPKIKRP